MSDEILVQYGSPTLAGIKTGSLFTCPCADREQTRREVRRLNKKLVPKGLRILPLRYSAERVLIYLYRPARLEKDLSNKEAAALLERAGYRHENANQCVIELIRRLNDLQSEFPHGAASSRTAPTGRKAASWSEPGVFTVMLRAPGSFLKSTASVRKIIVNSGLTGSRLCASPWLFSIQSAG